MMHTNEELKQLLQMPLADKITMSKVRIAEFYEHYDGNVVVSFSGGKDSTVLLHLTRSIFPDVKGVYCDTGLEYPEEQAVCFVRSVYITTKALIVISLWPKHTLKYTTTVLIS